MDTILEDLYYGADYEPFTCLDCTELEGNCECVPLTGALAAYNARMQDPVFFEYGDE